MEMSTQNKLVDQWGRTHDYLRISLTDACNLRCQYCMPEEDMRFMPKSTLMTADEIYRIARLFVALGVKKIRLTGGEPLLRKDTAEIIAALGTLPVTLALTTNGVFLEPYFTVLQRAGLRSINISLDALDPDINYQITRRHHLNTVIRNIEWMAARDFKVKVNMVVMKGVNEFEIPRFIEWSRERPLHIRFIEYMPFDQNGWTSHKVMTQAQILEMISAHFTIEKLRDEPNDTAKAWRIPGFAGTFAIISTMSEPFCDTCNRIRLTADGKFKNCLFHADEVDLLGPLRAGEDIENLIRETVRVKASRLGGQWDNGFEHLDPNYIRNRAMISIGG